MRPTARALRAVAQKHRAVRELRRSDHEQADRVVATATELFAEYGVPVVTFGMIAEACNMRPASLRRLFADHGAILAAVLDLHWKRIAEAVGRAGRTPRERRAAYFEVTRSPYGGLASAHLVWRRDRRYIPEDVAEP